MAKQRWQVMLTVLPLLLWVSSARPEGHVRRQDTNPSSIAVQQLVSGIGFNIMAQNGELAILSGMQNLAAAPTPDPKLFQSAKDDLLGFMSCGMRVRSNNMKISGINPQVTRGLAQLEETQVLQMALANNLTGDPSNDPTVITKLQGQVQAAIQKNSMLQAIATGGSAVPAAMMTKPVNTKPKATASPLG